MTFPSNTAKSPAVIFITASLLLSQFAFAADVPVKVNVDNFVRAETAHNLIVSWKRMWGARSIRGCIFERPRQ